MTMTMMIRISAPTPSSTADMLMAVSLIACWTDIGGPGCTGEPAPGGSGAPGGAAGRSTNAPGGPGDWGAGGCDQPLRSAALGPTGDGGRGGSGRRGGVLSWAGASCSFILATPMLV